jgi:UDP-N-acetyl-D-glucosamine dehydrogenase
VDPAALIKRIEDRDAVVGVIGLGYVGLPLVLEFCRAGFKVLGFDIDPVKCDALNRGRSYIHHIPAKVIQEQVDAKTFEATSDFTRTDEPDALLICVPTPLTAHREPDLSYVVATGKALAPHLRTGQLVVLESTTYPRTTEEVLQPELESAGLRAGTDFFLAYSPEREDPGNPFFTTGKIPKVVGGIDEESLQVAEKLYAQVVIETVPVSSARAAEAVKLTENIFRSVNIALVNELKMIYAKMDIDVWEVIEAAKTKPFGFMPFYPGPGLGGHCIPIDPFYLTWKAREYDCATRFVELAGEINTGMPDYVVACLTDALNDRGRSVKGARILVIGLAYKKDVGDFRESPSFVLMKKLIGRGAEVDYHDPYVPAIPMTRQHPELEGKQSVPWDLEAIAAYDVVLIATDHTNLDYEGLVDAAQLIIDTRNATKDVPGAEAKVVRA